MVIGILIALSINNWNEQYQERKEELRLLQKFKTDFTKEVLELKRCQNRERKLISHVDSMFVLMGQQNNQYLDSFIELSRSIGFVTEFRVSSGTYEEAVSSGKMDVILNDSLRELLFNYYRLAQYNQNDKISLHYHINEIFPSFANTIMASGQVIQSEGSPNTPIAPINLNAIAKNKDFNKALVLRKANATMQIRAWNEILEFLNILSTKVDQEIHNKQNN